MGRMCYVWPVFWSLVVANLLPLHSWRTWLSAFSPASPPVKSHLPVMLTADFLKLIHEWITLELLFSQSCPGSSSAFILETSSSKICFAAGSASSACLFLIEPCGPCLDLEVQSGVGEIEAGICPHSTSQGAEVPSPRFLGIESGLERAKVWLQVWLLPSYWYEIVSVCLPFCVSSWALSLLIRASLAGTCIPDAVSSWDHSDLLVFSVI